MRADRTSSATLTRIPYRAMSSGPRLMCVTGVVDVPAVLDAYQVGYLCHEERAAV
jgi:hypothetical protein